MDDNLKDTTHGATTRSPRRAFWQSMRGESRPPMFVPYAVATILAFMTLVLPPHADRTSGTMGLFAAVLAVVVGVGARLTASRTEHGSWARVAPAYAFFGVVMLLRHAEGGAASGFGPLVLLPATWVALNGTRAQLGVCFALVAAVFLGPMLLLDASMYPESELRRALLWLAVLPPTMLAVQELVEKVDRARRREADMARTDALTGLLNRRGFMEQASRAAQRGLRDRRAVAVAIFDLDNFKEVNDSQGHAAGDQLLRAAAAAWREASRPEDIIARWGGEEFVILMAADSAVTLANAADRIRRSLKGATASAGVAIIRTHDDGLDAAIAAADEALYRAKSQGRDRTEVAHRPVPTGPPPPAAGSAGSSAGIDG